MPTDPLLNAIVPQKPQEQPLGWRDYAGAAMGAWDKVPLLGPASRGLAGVVGGVLNGGDFRGSLENEMKSRDAAEAALQRVLPGAPKALDELTSNPVANAPGALSKVASKLPGLAEAMFIGPAAMLSKRESLQHNLARIMELDKSKSPEAVREAIHADTNWFRGPTGHWRKEISDHEAKFNFEGIRDQPYNYRLQDVLHHPELFDRYPQFKDHMVSHIPLNEPNTVALYRQGDKQVLLNATYEKGITEELAKSAVLHELQHGIQKIEDPNIFKNYFSPISNEPDAFRKYHLQPVEKEPRAVQNRIDLTPEDRSYSPPWQSGTSSDDWWAAPGTYEWLSKKFSFK